MLFHALLSRKVFANTPCCSRCPCASITARPGRNPWDQHLCEQQNCSGSGSASFSMYSTYWEVVGKPKDVEGKAVPAGQGLWGC